MILCPRDGSELIEHVETPMPMWHCNTCAGAFIAGLPIHEFQSNGKKQPREEWDIEVLCPKHKERTQLLTVKNVAIDICPTCSGVWLDGGEIQSLLDPDYSKQLAVHNPSGGVWSEADILSPLIVAALSALFNG
jgi:Zn-finger nucleic acid-binding protein